MPVFYPGVPLALLFQLVEEQTVSFNVTALPFCFCVRLSLGFEARSEQVGIWASV